MRSRPRECRARFSVFFISSEMVIDPTAGDWGDVRALRRHLWLVAPRIHNE